MNETFNKLKMIIYKQDFLLKCKYMYRYCQLLNGLWGCDLMDLFVCII